MSTPGFAAELEREAGRTMIRLRGELEDATAAQARAAFDEALADSPPRLVIDFSGLEFMDSTGIWLVVETHRRCVAAGIQLGLEGEPTAAVASTLALSGVEELVSGSDQREDNGALPGAQPLMLRLYVSSRSAGGAALAAAVRALGDRLPGTSIELEVIDVFDEPARAKRDRVIATPTLIKVEPPPELRLIGSIADPDAVLRHLGLGHLVA